MGILPLVWVDVTHLGLARYYAIQFARQVNVREESCAIYTHLYKLNLMGNSTKKILEIGRYL